MPRFFFEVTSGNSVTQDTTGEIFTDEEAASAAGLDILHSVVRDEGTSPGRSDYKLEVRGETGQLVFGAAVTITRQ